MKWAVLTKHYEIRAIPLIHFVLLLIFASSNLTLKKIGLYDILQNAFLIDYQGTNHGNNTNHISIQHTIKVILCQIFGIIFVTPILRITVNFMGQWDIEKL